MEKVKTLNLFILKSFLLLGLVGLTASFLLNYYSVLALEQKIFDICVESVTFDSASWDMKKETVNYCKEEIKSI